MKKYLMFNVYYLLFSATWFTIGDKLFHVNNKILVYHWLPLNGGQSLLAFSAFFLLSISISMPMYRFSSVHKDYPNYTLIVNCIIINTLLYWISGLVGNSHPMILFWAALAFWVVRILSIREHRTTAIMASIVMGVVGPFAEGFASKIGYFDYYYTNIFNVPLWLAALYLHGGLMTMYSITIIQHFNRLNK